MSLPFYLLEDLQLLDFIEMVRMMEIVDSMWKIDTLQSWKMTTLRDALDEHLSSCTKFRRSPTYFYERFAKIKTHLDRVNFVLEELNHAQISAGFRKDEKIDTVSEQYKKEGNFNFGRGEYIPAFAKYSKCILQAKSKELLALGYANRSAVLFKLNLFKECVEDIDRALTNNYPQELRAKLIYRRNEALKRRNPKQTAEHEEIPQISKKNPRIQCASDSVEIQYSEIYGRHVIATKDIEIGEVIAVEDPFACVYVDSQFTHCHNCARLCYNLIPCPTCSVTLYCNETCREKAFAAYHKYECAIAGPLKMLQIDNSKLLPLRIVFLIEDERKKMNVVGAADEEDQTYRSDRSTEILKLITHADKRSNRDLFQATFITSLIFQLVKKTKFICSTDGVDEEKFKETLLTVSLICAMNGSAISIVADFEKTGFYDLTTIGGGIYPFYSLFNHSCCPNVANTCYGTSFVLRATKTIKKGDQCFVSYRCLYGPAQWTFSARQEMMKRDYHFTCTCKACKKLWPPVGFIPRRTQVRRRVRLDELSDNLQKPDVAFARRTLPKLIKEFKKNEHLEPCPDLMTLHSLIVRCYDVFGSKRFVL